MPVYDDYMNHRWDRYFTSNFRRSHLRPHEELPLGGHRGARERARLGNLGHNARGRDPRRHSAFLNSVIYDFDPRERIRQVLRLMQEVEARNADGFFVANGHGPHETGDDYAVATTAPGSRQSLAFGPFRYGVLLRREDGRRIINHYDGMATD